VRFRLLNGAQSGPDGKDFNYDRPTKISDTASYNSEATYDIGASGTTGWGNDGLDVLGVDTPLGTGRSSTEGQDFIDSIIMLAKVSPTNSAPVTYAWGRVYQSDSVTISQTTTNTWYVNMVGSQIGVPTPKYDTKNPTNMPSSFYTTIPSTNHSVLAMYDNPGMLISRYTAQAPNTNDFAYTKKEFFYALTNSIGSTNAVAIQPVGQIMVIKRIATTGTIATDWSAQSNVISTAIIPDCTNFTSEEISAIVSPSTNRIIFAPSVPVSP